MGSRTGIGQTRRRWIGAVALALALTTTTGAQAMDQARETPAATSVRCTAATPKVALPRGLCARLVARLGAAYPDRGFALAGDGTAAAVELQVSRADARSLEARLTWNGIAMGQPQAMVLSGGTLSETLLDGFLDALIAANPPA